MVESIQREQERSDWYWAYLALFELENEQPACHMRYHRVLAMVLEGICPARRFGVAAGAANEGSRKTGWKMAGILDQAASCIAWMLEMVLLKETTVHHIISVWLRDSTATCTCVGVWLGH